MSFGKLPAEAGKIDILAVTAVAWKAVHTRYPESATLVVNNSGMKNYDNSDQHSNSDSDTDSSLDVENVNKIPLGQRRSSNVSVGQKWNIADHTFRERNLKVVASESDSSDESSESGRSSLGVSCPSLPMNRLPECTSNNHADGAKARLLLVCIPHSKTVSPMQSSCTSVELFASQTASIDSLPPAIENVVLACQSSNTSGDESSDREKEHKPLEKSMIIRSNVLVPELDGSVTSDLVAEEVQNLGSSHRLYSSQNTAQHIPVAQLPITATDFQITRTSQVKTHPLTFSATLDDDGSSDNESELSFLIVEGASNSQSSYNEEGDHDSLDHKRPNESADNGTSGVSTSDKTCGSVNAWSVMWSHIGGDHESTLLETSDVWAQTELTALPIIAEKELQYAKDPAGFSSDRERYEQPRTRVIRGTDGELRALDAAVLWLAGGSSNDISPHVSSTAQQKHEDDISTNETDESVTISEDSDNESLPPQRRALSSPSAVLPTVSIHVKQVDITQNLSVYPIYESSNDSTADSKQLLRSGIKSLIDDPPCLGILPDLQLWNSLDSTTTKLVALRETGYQPKLRPLKERDNNRAILALRYDNNKQYVQKGVAKAKGSEAVASQVKHSWQDIGYQKEELRFRLPFIEDVADADFLGTHPNCWTDEMSESGQVMSDSVHTIEAVQSRNKDGRGRHEIGKEAVWDSASERDEWRNVYRKELDCSTEQRARKTVTFDVDVKLKETCQAYVEDTQDEDFSQGAHPNCGSPTEIEIVDLFKETVPFVSILASVIRASSSGPSTMPSMSVPCTLHHKATSLKLQTTHPVSDDDLDDDIGRYRREEAAASPQEVGAPWWSFVKAYRYKTITRRSLGHDRDQRFWNKQASTVREIPRSSDEDSSETYRSDRSRNSSLVCIGGCTCCVANSRPKRRRRHYKAPPVIHYTEPRSLNPFLRLDNKMKPVAKVPSPARQPKRRSSFDPWGRSSSTYHVPDVPTPDLKAKRPEISVRRRTEDIQRSPHGSRPELGRRRTDTVEILPHILMLGSERKIRTTAGRDHSPTKIAPEHPGRRLRAGDNLYNTMRPHFERRLSVKKHSYSPSSPEQPRRSVEIGDSVGQATKPGIERRLSTRRHSPTRPDISRHQVDIFENVPQNLHMRPKMSRRTTSYRTHSPVKGPDMQQRPTIDKEHRSVEKLLRFDIK